MRKFIQSLVILLVLSFAANALAEVGYAKGFFMKSDDGQFQLIINGKIQPQLLYNRWKQPVDPEAYQSVATEKKDKLSFSIRRTNLSFRAYVGEHITFGIGMFHATGASDSLRVTGGTVTYEFLPELVITAGMVGLPLDLISEMSSGWMLLTEWPVSTYHDDYVAPQSVTRPAFGVPEGLGVNLAGDIWKFAYSLSVVNGNENNYEANPDKKMSAGARFAFNILDPIGGSLTDFANSSPPKLTVSMGSLYQGKRNDSNTNAVISYLWTSSMGVGFRWKGFALTTEGYYRRMKLKTLPSGVADTRTRYTDIGYYAGLGYYIIPKKFEVAAQASQIFRQGPDNNVNEVGGSLNYYIWDNNLKLQLSYDWTEDYDDIWGQDSNHNHKFILSFMAQF